MIIKFLTLTSGALLLASCDFHLRLEILNATDGPITVTVGGETKSVAPGLSFSGRFPDDQSAFSIRSGNCKRLYPVPKLDAAPWRYLIGKSIKLRAMPSGVLLAYPPTPDVELKGNPLRAMSDSDVRIAPLRQDCH